MYEDDYRAQEIRILSEAVTDGLVDVDLYPPIEPELAYCMYWAIARFEAAQDSNYFSLATHPKSQSYWEHAYDRATHETTTDYFIVELARIAVSYGQIGFLTSIEQVLRDINGAYYPTSKDYWGAPDFVDTDVSQCRWYLTLDYYNGVLPPRFTYSSTVPIGNNLNQVLPGTPFPDLYEIDALWYPAHSRNARIKAMIPGARMLRFFFYTPPTDTYQWVVRGRLRAQIQGMYSYHAELNARTLCF